MGASGIMMESSGANAQDTGIPAEPRMPDSHPVALITGAARRVGARIARRLHAAGYDLALHHRASQSPVETLVRGLEARRPGRVLVLQQRWAFPRAERLARVRQQPVHQDLRRVRA